MKFNELYNLQKEYNFFSDMLKSLEKKKKKTPGNGFAMMKCKEKLAELDKIFDDIDYAAQITFD
jgi:predicted CopG family antitoxin